MLLYSAIILQQELIEELKSVFCYMYNIWKHHLKLHLSDSIKLQLKEDWQYITCTIRTELSNTLDVIIVRSTGAFGSCNCVVFHVNICLTSCKMSCRVCDWSCVLNTASFLWMCSWIHLEIMSWLIESIANSMWYLTRLWSSKWGQTTAEYPECVAHCPLILFFERLDKLFVRCK